MTSTLLATLPEALRSEVVRLQAQTQRLSQATTAASLLDHVREVHRWSQRVTWALARWQTTWTTLLIPRDVFRSIVWFCTQEESRHFAGVNRAWLAVLRDYQRQLPQLVHVPVHRIQSLQMVHQGVLPPLARYATQVTMTGHDEFKFWLSTGWIEWSRRTPSSPSHPTAPPPSVATTYLGNDQYTVLGGQCFLSWQDAAQRDWQPRREMTITWQGIEDDADYFRLRPVPRKPAVAISSMVFAANGLLYLLADLICEVGPVIYQVAEVDLATGRVIWIPGYICEAHYVPLLCTVAQDLYLTTENGCHQNNCLFRKCHSGVSVCRMPLERQRKRWSRPYRKVQREPAMVADLFPIPVPSYTRWMTVDQDYVMVHSSSGDLWLYNRSLQYRHRMQLLGGAVVLGMATKIRRLHLVLPNADEPQFITGEWFCV